MRRYSGCNYAEKKKYIIKNKNILKIKNKIIFKSLKNKKICTKYHIIYPYLNLLLFLFY